MIDSLRIHIRTLFLLIVLSYQILSCRDSDESDSSGNSGVATTFGETIDGIATYYDADGSGACMFDPSPGDMNVAALNAVQWSTSAWCGACAEVIGPRGTVRVRIVDLCPECDYGHLDMSPEAFEQVAELSLGRVDITWQFVSCEVLGPVTYKYKDGSNEWWTAIQVRDHRLPIAALEWSTDGETWQPTERTEYNYFLEEDGVGADSIRVRITAIDGQTIEDELPSVESELEVEGASQFE